MTLFTNAQVKLIAANDAGDIKVYTDFIQAGLYATLFPAMKNAIEATVEAFAEPEQSQDVVAHVWHTFSKEFTNGGSDYGPKTRAALAEYLTKDLTEDALSVVKKIKGFQDASKAKALGKTGLGLALKATAEKK
jgi:hypothetical protein|tara:strand:+ start:81 stop:482 length:402 start_codon:yes stop_codon:yes gene_type:complete